MSVDILGTSCDQCRSMVRYSFRSTETRRLVRTDSPGRPPRLSHSSWTIANNLLHISHLKGYIFRWTLFAWECRSSDMVHFLSHCEQGKRGPSSNLWCCFCGGPGSFSAHMSLDRHLFLRSRSHQWMASCFHFHLGRNTHYTPISHCRHLHL